MLETVVGGVVMFDFDGDGDEDLFFVDGGALPGYTGEPARSRLFRNDGNGHFTDWTEKSGPQADRLRRRRHGGGHRRRRRSRPLRHRLRRRSSSSATTATARSRTSPRRPASRDPLWSSSAAFADVDNDGDLDLLVVNYVDFSLANNKLVRRPEAQAARLLPSGRLQRPAGPLLPQQGQRHLRGRHARPPGFGGARGPGLGVGLRRHRQRRLAGLLHRQRQQAQLPLPQQGERHLRGHLGALRHRDRRAGAPGGRDGGRHGGLRRRRPARHRGHQLRAGDQRPLPEPGGRRLRRQPLAGRHRRAVAARSSASASPSPISIRTATSTW